MLSILYDHPTISSPDNSMVQEINTFTDIAVDYSLPGNYLVEFFMWMKYIASSTAKWKRMAEEWHNKYSAMFEAMFHEVKGRIVRL